MNTAQKVNISYDFILSRLTELPTLPTVVAELGQILNDPMASTKNVVDIVEKDQSLTTKILKLINSGYFAMSNKVEKLDRAIALLGFNQVYQVIISTSVIQNFSGISASQFDPKHFWQHSLGTAIVAEAIANFINADDPSVFFTAGLIHDIGKIALLKVSPTLFLQIVDTAKQYSISFERAEVQMDTVKHEVIGHILSQKWKLHLNLQNAIKYHHKIQMTGRDFLTADCNLLIDVTILSNILVHHFKFGNSGHSFEYDAYPLLSRLHLEGEVYKKVLELAEKNLTKADDFLKIIGVG